MAFAPPCSISLYSSMTIIEWHIFLSRSIMLNSWSSLAMFLVPNSLFMWSLPTSWQYVHVVLIIAFLCMWCASAIATVLFPLAGGPFMFMLICSFSFIIRISSLLNISVLLYCLMCSSLVGLSR